ncbi:MAG: hypothetical protein LBV15_00360 [Planctomycetota bacterium]|jgi:hypothetical protein|nr:hypothetical protein [Planctomycetota bacterium]
MLTAVKPRLLLLALLLPLAAGARGAEELAHSIYVKVNGKTITQNYVVEAVKYLIKREYRDIPPEDEEEMERLQQAALRELVRTVLIHDEAQSLKVSLGRERLKGIIASSGLKMEEITPTIRRILEAEDLFEELMLASGTPISSPSPRAIKEFYLKNREEFRANPFVIVRTIFIPSDNLHPQSYFKARAEELIARLEAIPLSQRTEAFDRTARESSQDIFARNGGLLTGDSPERWIPREFNNRNPDGSVIFPPPMTEAIHRLSAKGEIRLAVSAEGMHLVYCEDFRGGREMPWNEAAQIIDYVLKQEERNRRLRSWLEKVYDRSDIRWHDGSPYERNLLTDALLPSERSAAAP